MNDKTHNIELTDTEVDQLIHALDTTTKKDGLIASQWALPLAAKLRGAQQPENENGRLPQEVTSDGD